LYATYLGYAGTQGDACGHPRGHMAPGAFSVAVDVAGNAYVTGQAEPGLRATPGALDMAPKTPTLYGGAYVASHAFVVKLAASGTALHYAARLGGMNRERGTAIAVDAVGHVYVAGKSTSPDFPKGGLFAPYVSSTCNLRTPELGFLAKLTSDGSGIVWSGSLPAAGSEIDDCGGGSAPHAPVSLALDAAGNAYVSGFTESGNRAVTMSSNAIQFDGGDAFFAQISTTGSIVYSTWLTLRDITRTMSVDSTGTVRIAGGAFVQTLRPGSVPVQVTLRTRPACANGAVTLDAQVIDAGDDGTVEFIVDGASIGIASVRAGTAALSAPLGAGIRRVRAVYRGSGPFHGQVSATVLLPVDQAGACP
jgi:hypothetical protein